MTPRDYQHGALTNWAYRPVLNILPKKQLVVDSCQSDSFVKEGDPAYSGSPTATLLRLHPSHRPHRVIATLALSLTHFW